MPDRVGLRNDEVKLAIFLRVTLAFILIGVSGWGGAAWPVQAQSGVCFNQVADSDFESLASDWLEGSEPDFVYLGPGQTQGQFFPYPIANWDGFSGSVQDYNAPAGPAGGEWWAWFGQGISNTASITQVMQFITQDVVIPANAAASLEFKLWISRADAGTGASDWLQVKLNETLVFTVTGALTAPYASGYQTVRVNVTPFATGLTTTLTISATTRAQQNGLPPIINFNVDDVRLCAGFTTFLPVVRK
jgi:hypothetical protein